ncbi:PLP-dependent aminotransferase family protein [Domibacillus sp. PGB-M46]|uniref:MocR-like pyridoxine biosynthesis transcription factor PdxR n=1 Tax=Domibacillus sp. PGB-M46 TaxID=2910255 RepID=UPI001F586715|nr:PLP-dependent aminotransferase family protein [Domibacillus sp. PGB-M46]MCI2255243.1 PLP-dependent aminotransferase family protein [Domibacillus sp. PGB-M46]
MDITFFLNRNLDIPLYQQLYRLLKENMHEGHIQKGIKLPSKRLLASQLSVSQTTVERAYEQLAAEGYIVSKPRSGWFADYDGSDFIHIKMPSTSSMKPKAQENEQMIDFHYGNVDSAHFPLSAWRKSMVNSLDQYGHVLYRPGDVLGELELRTLIAEHLYQSRGVRCLPEQVIIGAGSPVLMHFLCQVFGPNSTIGYEDPGSSRSRKIFEVNHMKILPIPVDHEGLCIEEIQKERPSLLYITPSHQFPLGTIMTINRRIELLKWAAQNQTFIIEDDYDGEFRYSGQPIPSLQGLDQHNRVIYMGTFSKSLLPSLRISYMILPAPLLEKGSEITSLYKQTVSCHSQLTLAEFIKNGGWQKHINRMRKLYQKKRAILLEALQSELGRHVKIRGENSGLHILLDVDSPFSEKELIEKAREHGVKIYPASVFYKKQPPTTTVLIGFAGVSKDNIREGIKKLKAAWEI